MVIIESNSPKEGVTIGLSKDELASAIDLYVYSEGFIVRGPRTIKVGEENNKSALIYIDPSGFCITPEGERIGSSAPTMPQDFKFKCVDCGAKYGSQPNECHSCGCNHVKEIIEYVTDCKFTYCALNNGHGGCVSTNTKKCESIPEQFKER